MEAKLSKKVERHGPAVDDPEATRLESETPRAEDGQPTPRAEPEQAGKEFVVDHGERSAANPAETAIDSAASAGSPTNNRKRTIADRDKPTEQPAKDGNGSAIEQSTDERVEKKADTASERVNETEEPSAKRVRTETNAAADQRAPDAVSVVPTRAATAGS